MKPTLKRLTGILLAASSLLTSTASFATCLTACSFRIHVPGIQAPTAQPTQLTANPAAISFGSVTVGQSVSQSFTLTNNGKQGTTSLTHTVPGGVVESDTCGQTLAAGASCTVTLSYQPLAGGALSDVATFSSQDSSAQVSLTGSAASVAGRMYVSDASSQVVDLCSVYADETLGACSAASGTVLGALGIAVSGQYAYVSNYNSNTIYSCLIGSNDALSNCTVSVTASTRVFGLAVNNGYLYGTDESKTGAAVTVCKIGAGGVLSGCALTGSSMSDPVSLAFSGSQVYVTNWTSNNVLGCTVGSDGTFSGCVTSNIGAPTRGIVISGSYAYVGTSSSILACQVSGLNLSNCTTAASAGVPGNMYALNGNLYVPNQTGGQVSTYQMNGSSLNLLGTVSGFGYPGGIAPAP